MEIIFTVIKKIPSFIESKLCFHFFYVLLALIGNSMIRTEHMNWPSFFKNLASQSKPSSGT